MTALSSFEDIPSVSYTFSQNQGSAFTLLTQHTPCETPAAGAVASAGVNTQLMYSVHVTHTVIQTKQRKLCLWSKSCLPKKKLNRS